jgi:hypothetical protein
LKYNKIGQTKSFSFSDVLRDYESESREIFKHLTSNQTIRHYEVMIGKFYENGFGIDKNYKKAFEWYMKASQQNDIRGHDHVGYCYYYGYGVEKNWDEAFKFFQLSANDGLNITLNSLASCYQYGYGTQKNNIMAFNLYKQSAENGFVQSQYEVAKCYQNGIGICENNIEALRWYKLYQESDGKYDVSSEIKDIEKELVRMFYIFFILSFIIKQH